MQLMKAIAEKLKKYFEWANSITFDHLIRDLHRRANQNMQTSNVNLEAIETKLIKD